MLEDRAYIREGRWRPQWSVTFLLMAANLIAFALQEINAFYFGYPVERMLALSNDGLSHGYVWQLITFQFLHAGFWHLAFNLLAMFFFGRLAEERLGGSTMLALYLLSGLVGGLAQLTLGALWPQHFGVAVLGASAGVFGLLTATALLEPDSSILLFFILPIRARYFLIFAAVVSFFYVLVPNSRVAHAAHLGGMAGAYAYLKWGHRVSDLFRGRGPVRSRLRARELIRANKGGWQRRGSPEELSQEEFISREVDPILDKISAQGFQSLTPREKQILETARSRMERH